MEVLSPMKLAINLPATVEIDGADGSLLCPVCSATYIHQKAVTVFLRREDATTGFRVRIEGDEERAPVITVGSNLGGNPSLRRHGTAISFWCEMRADIYPGVCPTQGGNFRFVAGDRSSARQCAAMTADVCNFDYFTVRACVIRSDSGLMTKRIRLIDGVLDKQPAASAWTGLYRPIEFCGNANDILAALSRELHAFTPAKP